MTDKAPKYPEDFGDGIEIDYGYSKTQKILMIAMLGCGILVLYYFIQINTELKPTDWTFDNSQQWDCKKLASLEKFATSDQVKSFDMSKMLKGIHDKQQELQCP